MIKNKKQMYIVIGAFLVVLTLFTTTYAFFNYTRTGSSNTIRVGRISFNTSQSGTINLVNVFPIDSNNVGVDTNNSDTVTISITGDTTYTEGIEYLVTFSDLSNTVNGKTIPISYVAEVDNIGDESSTYWTSRGSTTSVYKLMESGTVTSNKKLLIGYIKPDNNGIDGSISITAFLDKDSIAISDTYNGEESDNMGTTNDWVDERVVLTTSEWNQLQTNGVSFKVKVEANEGIWVSGSENLADKIKGRLGQDGVVAVNTNGDLYDGTGTIREYRYSGIGNYCTYTDGTNNYNISVEGTDCPEHAYKGNEGYITIGSSDGFSLWGTNNETELNRVNTTATDSGLKNYVMFNNEKWRIIGVFGNNVKIMKDLPLTEDLTSNPVDTTGLNGASANDNQIYTNTMSEQYLIKYVAYENQHKYGYFMYNLPVDSNYSYNPNDWTHSGLMYYLNENNTGSYYNTIGASYKSLIDNTTYYLGNVSISEDSNNWWVVDGTAKEVFEQERGSVECAASVTSNSQSSNCNIWNGNSATWTGKIGLLYPSDYGYASSSDKWSTNEEAYYYNGGSLNNWMFNTDAGASWMISPASYGSYNAVLWNDYGIVGSNFVDGNYAVRPVLNLISEAEVVDGDGSYSNPYILNVE